MWNAIRSGFRYVLAIPSRMFGLPKRLLSLSFPMRVAVLLAIFLALLTVTAFIGFLLSHDRGTIDVSEWFDNWQKITLVLILEIAAPIVVYHAIKLWLMPETSRFPNIDQAWHEGIQALQQNGLELGEIPLFLILGAADESGTQNLMRASGLSFVVEGAPDGRAPIKWYATDDAIYLVIPGVGCLSRFNSTVSPHSPSAQFVPSGATSDIKSTWLAGQSGPSIEGTAGADPPKADSTGGIRGTIVASEFHQPVEKEGASGPPSRSGKTLSHSELDEATVQLEYVCQLIEKSRHPVCGINGILTLLQGPNIDGSLYVAAARDMPDAIRRDLDTVRETLKLICPVTALVVGMENEPGFTELVRRIGFQAAKEARYGKGFVLWNAPSTSSLDALSTHVCGAFEDSVYRIFKEDGGLHNMGNGKLYSLLCKIRSRWHSRLRGILLNGFASDNDEQPALFGGCYFAATGASEDSQAFVRSVIGKMNQQEEELEWTTKAIQDDERYHRLAKIGMYLNLILVLALIGIGVYCLGGFGS